MSEIESSILEKIQKLLTLQKGAEAIGSLHEAELAATKAGELLLKYNLDLADVTGFQKPESTDIHRFDEREIINPKNEGQWIHSLYHVISRHNFCKMIRITIRGGEDYVSIIGTKDNVESVKFISQQVESRIRTAESHAWKRNLSDEKRNAFRRGFFMGAVRGIDVQLTEKRKQDEMANNKVTTLVVVTGAKLDKFIQNEFHHLRSGKATRGLSANNGYAAGHAEGRSMNINKGVGGSTINNKYLS